jgi:hypothetical protein
MLNQRPTVDITLSNQYQICPQVDNVKSPFNQSVRDNIAELYDLHCFESAAERLGFIDSLLADNEYFFLVAERVEEAYAVQIQCQESRKLITNG